MAREPLSARLGHIDQHIAQTERRIMDQAKRIERLATSGYDTSDSRELLCTLKDTLSVLKHYRRTIEGLIHVRQEIADLRNEINWSELHPATR